MKTNFRITCLGSIIDTGYVFDNKVKLNLLQGCDKETKRDIGESALRLAADSRLACVTACETLYNVERVGGSAHY